MEAVKVVLTYADYVALPDDGKRYEILDGELSVTAAWRLTKRAATTPTAAAR